VANVAYLMDLGIRLIPKMLGPFVLEKKMRRKGADSSDFLYLIPFTISCRKGLICVILSTIIDISSILVS
jgi:hypothetical protein